jgi:hypothetical protein
MILSPTELYKQWIPEYIILDKRRNLSCNSNRDLGTDISGLSGTGRLRVLDTCFVETASVITIAPLGGAEGDFGPGAPVARRVPIPLMERVGRTRAYSFFLAMIAPSGVACQWCAVPRHSELRTGSAKPARRRLLV